MTVTILLVAFVIIACILCNKLSNRVGIPMLLAFILLGMVFGSDGLLKLEFENFQFAEQFCSVALIFIIFYGGFGTNWREAKRVAKQSLLLSSAGVLLTALLVGAFCHWGLGFGWYEGLLVGAVLSSTDAASVFSLLRSKKLNLKDGTASMLELESGSNDPWAYMMTLILLRVMSGTVTVGNFFGIILSQVLYGAVMGWVIAAVAHYVLVHVQFENEGFDTIFIVAVALLSYALPSYFGGNGYLSAYIVGILLGNGKIPNKRALVHFFDGATGLMQMFIFFLLGLLAFPSQMGPILVPAILIFLFLSVVARPVAVLLLLTPFRSKWSQQAMVAWSGLRGATSIVFAIMVQVSDAYTNYDVFHIAFFIVLLSIGIQGTLLPFVARRLGMIDNDENVMRTFSDYAQETEVQFLLTKVGDQHPWAGREIREIALPPNIRIAVIFRAGEKLLPRGNTRIEAGDEMVLSTPKEVKDRSVELYELSIDAGHEWCGRAISELPLSNATIVLVKRRDDTILPNGSVQVREGDTLVVLYGS